MSDTRLRSWEHHDCQDEVKIIATYADIGVGPAVVFDGAAFTGSAGLRAYIRDLTRACDWLEAEVAPYAESGPS